MSVDLDDTARLAQNSETGDVQTTGALGGATTGKTMEYGLEIDAALLAQFDDEDDPMFLNEQHREQEMSKGYFQPDSAGRTYWELLMVTFTLYCAYAIPIYMAWNTTASGFWKYFEYAMDLSFVIDLFLNFRTGYYDPELHQNVYNQRKIIIHYAKGWLFIDAFAAFPLSMLGDSASENLQMMRIIRLSRTGSRMLRMLKVIKANKMVVSAQNNYEINPAYVQITKFSVLSTLLTHMLTCLWYYSAASTTTGLGGSDDKGRTWSVDNWLYQYGIAEDASVVRVPPGLLSALGVSHSKSVLYGAF
jgi:hypothetical protein